MPAALSLPATKDMIDNKELLKIFSDKPITISDLQNLGYDIDSREFIDAFLWLKSEVMIKPLSGNSYGLVDGYDMVTWSEIDLIITSDGKNYLNPIKTPSDKVSNWLIKPLTVAVLTALICTPISYYIGTGLKGSDCKEAIKAK